MSEDDRNGRMDPAMSVERAKLLMAIRRHEAEGSLGAVADLGRYDPEEMSE